MPRMDKKKLHTWPFQLKHSSRNMRCKLLQKRFAGKTTERSKHLRHIAIEKNILSKLNECIFQIPLNYINLVIPNILFILVLCSSNFYFKITWRSPFPPHNNITLPTKIEISNPPPPSKDFSEIFNPCPQSWREGGVPALKAQLKLCPLIQNRVLQDYLPGSYARHLSSYQKCPKLLHPSDVDCSLSPEHLWVTLGMRKNSIQQPKIYSFPPSEKSPLIDLNLLLSKVSFLPLSNSNFQVIILCNLHL